MSFLMSAWFKCIVFSSFESTHLVGRGKCPDFVQKGETHEDGKTRDDNAGEELGKEMEKL